MAIPSLLGGHRGGGLQNVGFGHYSSADTASAFALTATPSTSGIAMPVGCSVALVTAMSQGLRARHDGVAPTASVGLIIPTNEYLCIQGDLSNWRFINLVAGAGMAVTYFG